MNLRLLLATVGCCIVFGSAGANAFMVDPDGNTNFDGSAKFTDPDEQLEMGFTGSPSVVHSTAQDGSDGSQSWFPTRTTFNRDVPSRDVSPR